MRNIIAYFVKYPITGNLLMVLILLFGVVGLLGTRSTFFPESDTKFIVVQTAYPGASPEEIEEGIVAKVEDNLKGLTGIDRVTSVSQENSGQVTVEVKRGYDIDVVLQDVKNAVDQIGSFPEQMESPIIFKQEALTLALNFAVSGPVSLGTLKRFARKIEEDLLAVEGISKVELNGFPDEEIEISVRENDLRRFETTFEQVMLAVQVANIEVTGGTIKGQQEELLIRSRSKGYYAEDLRQIVVATTPDGRQVRLSDVAEVEDRWSENPNRVYLNGQPAVRISVSNTTDESLLFISETLNQYVDDFNVENDVIKATIISDGAELLRQRINLLTKNGVIGFFLVLALLAMFLQIRMAFWVALAIPVSLVGMFIFAPGIDLSINVISLFGMILVIGILVDDGIVVSENIYRQWEEGKPPLKAAVDGTMEVLPAVFSAILTTMVAFGTFFFLSGITGDFFSDMATVVVITLAFSLIEGALILPAHVGHSKALTRKDPDASPESGFVARVQRGFAWVQHLFWAFMDWMRDQVYAPSLKFFLRHAFLGLMIPIALLILAFSLIGGGLVKTTIFPFIEGDFITVNLRMPAGTREGITQQYLDRIEQAVWVVNDSMKKNRFDGQDPVRIVSTSIGPSTYQGTVLINLLDSEARGTSSLAIMAAFREETGPIYEAEVLTFSVSTPFGKPVSIAMTGNDLPQLRLAVEELKDKMGELTDLRDIADNNRAGLREVNVSLKDKALLLGLSPQLVIGQVRQGFFGAEVQRIQRGQDEVKIWVRYDEADRGSLGSLERMRIRLPGGQAFPLSEIAEVKLDRGVIAINRLDGRREIRVEAELAVADASTNTILAEIEEDILPPILAKYPSVRFSFEGQVRENAKTQESGQLVFPVAIVLIIAIILLTFRSFSQTIAVLLTIPFGLIGVLVGHWLLDKQFSFILSSLGVIALVGIMVNDALVMVSQFNNLMKEGKPFKEALYEAAISRFRPIFLTSVTTVVGLGPLMLEKSLQAQFLIPMAISIAFGLLVATLIILVTLPVLLVIFNQYKVYVAWLWTGTKLEPEEVEPAVSGRRTFYFPWVGVPLALAGLVLLITAFM